MWVDEGGEVSIHILAGQSRKTSLIYSPGPSVLQTPDLAHLFFLSAGTCW